MALTNNRNPKVPPIPVITSRMQITNTDGTPTRSGLLFLEQLQNINVFGPSGTAHSTGLVPDPGSTAGTTRFLREDATWQIPGGGVSARVTNPATTTGDILVQGPVQYSDLQTVMAQNIVYSAAHPFTSSDVGNQLTITGGAGWATGTYNMVELVPAATGAPTSYMVLSANVAPVGSTGGTGYTTTLTRLGVGSPGQVLTSNPSALMDAKSTGLGVQWANLPILGPSGPSHQAGMAPDPGSTTGATRYLREDATWAIPSGSGGGLTDPTTTLGDILVRGSAAVTRLGIGTNGQVLTADSTKTLGLAWETPAGGGAVTSVFGRTGAIVATAGDYTASQITGCQSPWLSNINGANFNLTNASQIAIGGTTPWCPFSVTKALTAPIANSSDPTGAGFVTLVNTTTVAGLEIGIAPAGINYVWLQGYNYSLANYAPIVLQPLAGSDTNVGIGVTNPAYKLDVAGDVNISTGSVYRINGAALVTGVSSVFGRSGAVVASSGDYTAAQVGAVANTVQVIAGSGLSGGGVLTANVTLSAVAMGASGTGHAAGIVPDPGATAGATRYLREDATWAIPSGTGGGMTDPTTTLGDIIVRGSSATTRLGVGTNGQVLTANSGATLGVQWSTPTTAPVTSVFTRTGAVVAASGDYSASQVTNAVDQTATYSNPAWISSLAYSKLTGVPAFLVSPLTTKGDVMVYGTATTRIGIGTDGQVLTADSTQTLGLKWATPASVPVASVFGRTGAVVATAGDYTASQITGCQTPWLSNINGGGFTLSNTSSISITTSASTWSLSISASNTNVAQALISSSYSAGGGGLAVQNDASHIGYLIMQGSTVAGGWADTLVLQTATAQPLVFATNNLEAMRITSGGIVYTAGNVGIGNNAATLPDSSSARIQAIVGPTSVNGASGVTVANYSTTATTGEVGELIFANYGISATEKRMGIVQSIFGGAYNSGALAFWTMNAGTVAEQMRIAANGYVGIGNNAATAPDSTTARIQAIIGPTGAAGNSGVTLANYSTTATAGEVGAVIFANYGISATEKRMGIVQSTYQGAFNSGLLAFWTMSAGTITQRMALTAGGILAVGSSFNPSAGAQVQVQGAGQTAYGGVGGTTISTTGALGGGIALQDTGTGVGNGGSIVFGAGSNLFAAIKSGMTNGTSNTTGDLSFQIRTGAANTTLTEAMHIYAAQWVGFPLFVGINMSTVPAHWFQLGSDDAAKPATNTWTVASDGRLKRNIKAFTHGLQTLLKFRPISYEYNGQGGMPAGLPGVGLVAQEAEEVYEPCVRKSPGKIDGRETDVLWTNVSDFTFMMLNALKEIDQRLRQLEAH